MKLQDIMMSEVNQKERDRSLSYVGFTAKGATKRQRPYNGRTDPHYQVWGYGRLKGRCLGILERGRWVD